MTNLQDLWSEIPEKSLEEDEIIRLLSRKSISEVDRFKRLLLIEIYISWSLAIVIFFIHESVGKEITALICITVFIGSLLNIITLRKINQLELLDDVRRFLKSALKALKAFVTGFILTIQIIGVFVITTFKYLKQDHISWTDWLSSEQGMSIIIIFFIIEVILISYAWIFYIKRILSLNNILREMDS